MKPTIVDIAKKAGVSTSTVSRVVNHYPFIKEETKRKVLNVIDELNYYPDLNARGMKKGRTFNIGLVIGGLGNPFFAETAEVIIKRAENFNCHVTLTVTGEDPQKMNECIDFLIAKRVDGVIIGSVSQEDESTVRLGRSGIPYVLYNRRREDSDYIIHDNVRGSFQAVVHLMNLGHTRIGLLHGPRALDTVRERVEGYFSALKSYKLPVPQELVKEIRYSQAEADLETAMGEMMQAAKQPTAVFATADFLAINAIDYLYKNGYKVPEDVAVMGFDNTKLSGHSLIGLSTVGMRADEMATLAVEFLIQKIERQAPDGTPWRITLLPNLIVRRSCGAILPMKKND